MNDWRERGRPLSQQESRAVAPASAGVAELRRGRERNCLR